MKQSVFAPRYHLHPSSRTKASYIKQDCAPLTVFISLSLFAPSPMLAESPQSYQGISKEKGFLSQPWPHAGGAADHCDGPARGRSSELVPVLCLWASGLLGAPSLTATCRTSWLNYSNPVTSGLGEDHSPGQVTIEACATCCL